MSPSPRMIVVGCCCCLGAGGGLVAWQPWVESPPPPIVPTLSPPQSVDTVPAPGAAGGGPLLTWLGRVTGSGAPGAGNPAAQRISSFVPHPAGYTELAGADALTYANRLAQFLPDLRPWFAAINRAGQCAIDNGVMAANAYVADDLRSAGVVAIFSREEMKQVLRIAVECLIPGTNGGGPGTSAFSPCSDSYQFTRRFTADGFVDTYYVFVAATSDELCATLRRAHETFELSDIQL